MGRPLDTLRYMLPLVVAAQALTAFGADSNPPIANKHLLPNAVQIQITPRGMQYFDKKLSNILGNLGVKLDEGYFPAMSYSFEKAINPDDYLESNPETVQIYKQVRDLLTNWLVGFSLNDHRPHIEIGESGYIAQFARFSLVTDEALMESLGRRDGAVLAIELEVKKLTLATKSAMAWDLNNEYLGKVGFEDVTLHGGAEDAPLKVRLPFYIRLNAYGGLDFEALPLIHNIDRFPLALQYKNLLVPNFSVEVNGKKFNLNTSQLEKTLSESTPLILSKVRDSLSDFATKQLPELLNQKAKEFFTGSLEQVQDMSPPGQDDNDHRPDFKWGLQLSAINLKKSLNINLTGYVEDTLNLQSSPRASDASRGAPTLGQLPLESYDLSLALDRSLVNRILQLSFQRKNFEKINQSDGSVLKLTSAPTIDYVKTPAGVPLTDQETILKMRISVENRPDSMFLKDVIVVEFDIIAKLRQMADKSGMQLVLMKIDENSMYLDDKYISLAGKLLKGTVRNGVKDELREKSKGWEKTEEVLEGSFPLPPEILGIKLDIKKVLMDPNGHIVMYLNYATGVK
ncbi:hypothetical protein D3C87_377200 [compost metagenome]